VSEMAAKRQESSEVCRGGVLKWEMSLYQLPVFTRYQYVVAGCRPVKRTWWMIVPAEELRKLPEVELGIDGVVPYSTTLSVVLAVSQQTHMVVGEGSCR
jgi:hypothetical protein